MSGLGRVGRGISVSACLCNRRRRASGPLVSRSAPMQMGGEKLPSDDYWARRQWPTVEARPALPSFPPLSPLNLSCFIAYTSLSHTTLHLPPPSPLSFCYCSSKDGVGSDKVLGLIDGQSWRLDERIDGGRGGSLTQANTERQRGTTCSAMQPLTAPQQFSPPLTQCRRTLSLATCLVTVHMNNCDSMQRLQECSAPQRTINTLL